MMRERESVEETFCGDCDEESESVRRRKFLEGIGRVG